MRNNQIREDWARKYWHEAPKSEMWLWMQKKEIMKKCIAGESC